MIDTDMLGKRCLQNIAQALGWEPADFENPKEDIPGEYLDQITRMSREEAFRHFCEWNGLLNWSVTLMSVVDELDLAEFTQRSVSVPFDGG